MKGGGGQASWWEVEGGKEGCPGEKSLPKLGQDATWNFLNEDHGSWENMRNRWERERERPWVKLARLPDPSDIMVTCKRRSFSSS